MFQQRQQCAHGWLSLCDWSKAMFKRNTTERLCVVCVCVCVCARARMCAQNKHFAFYLKF